MSYRSYRDVLLDELRLRQARNARYSLRAFSRDLDISPGFLSLVLAAKRCLSKDMALAVARRLGWSANQTAELQALLCIEGIRDLELRQQLAAEIGRYYAAPAGTDFSAANTKADDVPLAN